MKTVKIDIEPEYNTDGDIFMFFLDKERAHRYSSWWKAIGDESFAKWLEENFDGEEEEK